MTNKLNVQPMTADVDPLVIDDLRERLSRTRLSRLDDDGERGISGPWLEELLEDWKGLNATTFPHSTSGLTHLSANIDGQRVHLAMAEGRGPNPTPLLLCNGWPSSFYEYLDVLPLLTDPAAHGGTAQDAFTVVIPTMPGFGFSAPPPPGGLTAAQIGEMWHTLMTEGLGFDRFVAHGSDLGAGVVPQLARAHPRSVAGIHLASPAVPLPPRPWSPAVERYAKEVETWAAEEGSYAHQHATKPDTIGVALQDSPAGLAAWIGEKVVAWSSPDPDGRPAFPRDLLLANLTLYWATGTIATSMLPYWKYRHTPSAALPIDDPSSVPTSVSLFGGERVPFPRLPRELAERYFSVTSWDEHETGGHFPAAATPELFAETLRLAFRETRP